VKTKVGGWPQPRLGAGRADKESPLGDAPRAFETGREIMELRHLRYFVAVAEELHFSRAAERLHVVQPAVSEQVRKLEEELGVRLFDRTHRNVALTDAGAALLPEAHRVLRQAEAARLAARSASDRAGHLLRIGYVPTALLASIPQTLRRVVASTPNLKTTMEPGPGLELCDAVRAGELDVAVVSLPVPTAGLRVTPLGEQRAVAVFPTGHEHALKPHVGLEQIAPERIVVLPRDADRPFYDAVLTTCCAAGISPTLIEMPDGQVDRVLLAVASGSGMALLPECAGERYADAGVRFVALDGESPVLTTAIVSSRHTEHLPTVAFLRAVSRTLEQRRPIASERSVLAA
jgi:DNA-binding transcriptional LysR family regulator